MKAGAGPTAVNTYQETMLHTAAGFGYRYCAQLLPLLSAQGHADEHLQAANFASHAPLQVAVIAGMSSTAVHALSSTIMICHDICSSPTSRQQGLRCVFAAVTDAQRAL